MLYFAGSVAAFTGMQIGRVVLPILIFQLTGSAFQTALLVTVQMAPSFVFGLFAGAVADRANRRLIMVTFYSLNGLILASIPVMLSLGVLTIERLYAAAFLSASAYVWSEAADFGARPAIVGRRRLVEASSLMHAAWTVTGVVALPIGGVLAAALGAGPALWINAGTYLVIAATLPFVRRPFNTARERFGEQRSGISQTLHDIGDGMRFIRRHSVQWPITLLGSVSAVVIGAGIGLVVVYGVRHLGLAEDDARIGLLYAAGAIGALGAATVLPRLVKRIGPGTIALGAQIANAGLLAALAFAPSLAIGVELLLLWEFAIMLGILNVIALRQQITPDHLQSRVNTTVRMVAAAGLSLGAAIGGFLADQISIRATYLIMSIAVALIASVIARSAIGRIDRATVQRYITAVENQAGGVAGYPRPVDQP